MRPLLAAALGLAAAIAPAAHDPSVETLFEQPHARITAFAQDGPLVAWFAPGARGCNAIHVLSLQIGGQVLLPAQGAQRNVTCHWRPAEPVGLAIAYEKTRVLWTLRDSAPLPFDFVIAAGVGDRREHRIQELAHTNRGSGLWLGGVAGDGPTLVYAVTSIDYEDEAGCLAGTGSCALKIVDGAGGIYRVIGRGLPEHVPNTTNAVAVAASDQTVAYAPAASVGKDGQPMAAADVPIEVVDANTGRLVSRIHPEGTPVALALAPHVIATLERTPIGLRLAWYARDTGAPSGSIPVAATASPELTAGDRLIVYHVGRSIRAVDVVTHRARTLARAAAPPIGLSLEGARLAWAENLQGSARIRALLTSRG
jgi:hypothetical protein